MISHNFILSLCISKTGASLSIALLNFLSWYSLIDFSIALLSFFDIWILFKAFNHITQTQIQIFKVVFEHIRVEMPTGHFNFAFVYWKVLILLALKFFNWHILERVHIAPKNLSEMTLDLIIGMLVVIVVFENVL